MVRYSDLLERSLLSKSNIVMTISSLDAQELVKLTKPLYIIHSFKSVLKGVSSCHAGCRVCMDNANVVNIDKHQDRVRNKDARICTQLGKS